MILALTKKFQLEKMKYQFFRGENLYRLLALATRHASSSNFPDIVAVVEINNEEYKLGVNDFFNMNHLILNISFKLFSITLNSLEIK